MAVARGGGETPLALALTLALALALTLRGAGLLWAARALLSGYGFDQEPTFLLEGIRHFR